MTPREDGGRTSELRRRVSPSLRGVFLLFLLPIASVAGEGGSLVEPFGIDLGKLTDAKPLSADETSTVMKVLYRWGGPPRRGESYEINSISLAQAERAARSDADKLDFAAQSGRVRGECFALRGRVVSVEPQPVAAELAPRFDFADYYRCRLALATNRVLTIYAREVPQAWRKGARPDQPGGALAVYLKMLPGAEGPLLAARRIAWYPDTPLGRLGMDVGLLDGIEDRKPLRGEQEAFYQMLSAVRRASPGRLMSEADAELRAEGRASSSVVPLFNQPGSVRGRLVALSGSARRAVKIFIDDPEIVARLGIDHYYEIGLFTADSQDNPLVICTPELPAGMPPGEDSRYLEEIRAAGFFFKVWAYRSSRLDQGKPVAQLAPLVIAQTPVWQAAPKRERNPVVGFVSAGLLLGGLLLAGWMMWQTKASYSRRIS